MPIEARTMNRRGLMKGALGLSAGAALTPLAWGASRGAHAAAPMLGAALQRPDWHASFDADKEAAAAMRKRLFDQAATDRIPVTGYHMPFPAVGYIEKAGDAYRWVPAS